MRVNSLKSSQKKKERFSRNDDSSLIITNKELTKFKRWKYFDELFNCVELEEVLNFSLGARDVQECTEPTLK